MNYRRNDDSMLKLMTMLFDECFGDRVQSQLLVIAYYQAKNKQKQQEMHLLLDTVQNVEPVMLYGVAFRVVTDEIDHKIHCAEAANTLWDVPLSDAHKWDECYGRVG